MASKLTKAELALEIADCGGWEEFHQKRHEYTMSDYYKGRRLTLQAQYNELNDLPKDKESA